MMADTTRPTANAAQNPTQEPLIIWRTSLDGGRHLAASMLLDRGAELDPFGADGAWRELARGWQDPWQLDGLQKRLRSALSHKPALMHTVLPSAGAFDLGLLQVTGQLGYRHLVLHRRQGKLRLAQALLDNGGLDQEPTPDSVRRLLDFDLESTRALARVRLALGDTNNPRHCAALDDLTPGPQSDPAAAWQGLADFLGSGRADNGSEWARQLHDEALHLAARIQTSTWNRTVRVEGAWLPHLDMPPSFLRPRIAVAAQATSPTLRVARFGALPALLHEGESLMLGGSVLLSAQPSDDGLMLQQGNQLRSLTWGQASPAIGQSHPDEPGAPNARFKLTSVSAHRLRPARILHRDAAKDTQTLVADLSFDPVPDAPVPGILLAQWSLGYVPIPKVACTSIKEALFRLGTGGKFSPEVAAGDAHVHSYFDRRSCDISAAKRRLVVVRDPIQRFLSGYSNRVVHHKELSQEYVQRQPAWKDLDLQDFVFDPDINEFVDRLDIYRQISTIDHHFRPMSEFLPPLSSFDKVYRFEALDEFCHDVAFWTDSPFELGHMQRGGPKLTAAVLSPSSLRKLLDFYAADYDMLAGLYLPKQPD